MRKGWIILMLCMGFFSSSIATEKATLNFSLDLGKNASLTNRGNSADKDFSLTKMKEESTKALSGSLLYGLDANINWNIQKYLVKLGINVKTKNLMDLKHTMADAKEVHTDILTDHRGTSDKQKVEHFIYDLYGRTGYNFNLSSKIKLAPMVGAGYRKELIGVVYDSASDPKKAAALLYNTVYLSLGAQGSFHLNPDWEVLLGLTYKYLFNTTTHTYGIEADDDIAGFTKDTKEISQKGNKSLDFSKGSYRIEGGIVKHFAEGDYGIDAIALKAYIDQFSLEREKNSTRVIAPSFKSKTVGMNLTLIF